VVGIGRERVFKIIYVELMGKQYELKLFLKLSQNGHKMCYCPVDIFGDGVHTSKGTVGMEAGKTYIFFTFALFKP
jgi:hypothetical protein